MGQGMGSAQLALMIGPLGIVSREFGQVPGLPGLPVPACFPAPRFPSRTSTGLRFFFLLQAVSQCSFSTATISIASEAPLGNRATVIETPPLQSALRRALNLLSAHWLPGS